MAMTLEGAVTRWGRWPDRFWTRVDKDGPVPEHRPELGPCWIWTGAKAGSGYGECRPPGLGRDQGAHVIAYELLVGPIPEGMQLDHECRVHACVNPAHTEPVPHLENQRRGLRGELTTHCPRGHEYTPENTRVYRGHRYCRACHRDRERARRLAKRERTR